MKRPLAARNTIRLAELHYVSGAERLPDIRYTAAGKPFNAPAGSGEGYWSLTERFVRVALERGAIAPQWEADTARLQTATLGRLTVLELSTTAVGNATHGKVAWDAIGIVRFMPEAHERWLRQAA